MADAVGSSHATNVHLSMLDWHQMRTLLRNAAVADINLSVCRLLNTVDATYDEGHGWCFVVSESLQHIVSHQVNCDSPRL